MATGPVGRAAPTVDVDPYSRDNLLDPYPMFRRLRAAGSVAHLPRWDVYAVTRHAEVSAVLRDGTTFSSAAGVGMQDPREPGYFRTPSVLLEQDPPDHTRMRTVFNPVLSGPAVKQFRDGAVERTRDLVDALLAAGTVDGVTDVAQVFPLRVLGDAVGLPAERRELLLAVGDLIFNGLGPPNELFQDSLERTEEAREWVARCMLRKNLATAGMGATIYSFVDDGTITEHEAGMLVRTFLSAGVDTTVSALSGALLHLASDPAQWAQLRRTPSLARPAFEEAVRMLAPVQVMSRYVTRATHIGDVAVPEGSRVLVYFAAANRDPAKWDDPDRFDLHRRPAGHMGFGTGAHACVGQVMARLQGEVLLAELARRIERIEPVGEPVWHLNNVMRGLASLPLRVIP